MTSNLALSLLVSALVGGGIAMVSVDDLSAINASAKGKLAAVQEMNDAQVFEAAQVMYELDGGVAKASAEELVAHGYLKPSYLTRERVQAEVPKSE